MVGSSMNFKEIANTITTLLLTTFLSRIPSDTIQNYTKQNSKIEDDLYSYQLNQDSALLQDAELRLRLRDDTITFDAALDFYKSQDERGDPFIDASLEELLKVKIIGNPSYDDLGQLTAFFTDEKNKQRGYVKHFHELGIKYIAIIDDFHDKSMYIGLAQISEGVLIVKAGLSERKGLISHELMHFYEKWLEKNMPHYLELKNNLLEVIGPYDKVIIRELNKNGIVISYKNYISADPKYGYVQRYGGKKFEEDIATYAEIPFLNPMILTKITDNFEIYQAKIDFFYKCGLFLEKEHKQYTATIENMRQFIAEESKYKEFDDLLDEIPKTIFPEQQLFEFCPNLSPEKLDFNLESSNSQDLEMDPLSSCLNHGIAYRE